MGLQGDHLNQLDQWCSGQCANAQGLGEGLLAPVQPVVPMVAQYLGDKLQQGTRGMHLVVDKIHRTSADYQRTDQSTAADLRSLYPAAYGGFPDIGELPGAGALGDFRDEDVSLTPPQDSASDDTTKAVHEMLMGPFHTAGVRAADHVFQWLTGQSLVDLLMKPLFGDFGRLKYLSEVYDQLGDGCYTVTGTIRKGSWKLGGEWQGDTATAFDQYLFLWSMGVGGVGDAAKIASKAFHDGYDVICGLVAAALRGIGWMLDTSIKALSDWAAKALEGDAVIEAVGLGPEDPFADIVAGVFTAAVGLYEAYQIVTQIINDIGKIEAIYRAIVEAVHKIQDDVHKVMAFLSKGLQIPSIGSLIDDVEQRGFEFEKNGFWSPELGAARMEMMPSA
ncbi:hypothetical protein [Streptacidiphilus jiangxiensis]|nr:hypothetical protein [Streptacidiphilus jiangxiensis]